jgi:hypothetical protein
MYNDMRLKNQPQEDHEEFLEYIQKVVSIRLNTQDNPVHGRFLRASNLFIIIENRSGSIISVAKSNIMSIRKTKAQLIEDGLIPAETTNTAVI